MGGCCQSREKEGHVRFSTKQVAEIRLKFQSLGQQHVFDSYERLDYNERMHLLRDASQLDVIQIENLYKNLILNQDDKDSHQNEKDAKLEPIEPKMVYDRASMSEKDLNELRELGYQKIREGKVAVVILAGGQGTRLGSDKPKGEYNIGLPSMKSIFQILTERFVKAQMLAAGTDQVSDDIQKCKLLIMTSPINDRETKKFFMFNNYFKANSKNVILFEQAVLPAISPEGKILLEGPQKIVMSPNGNGALFDAVGKNPKVKKILEEVEYVQVIGVDNVLNKVLDPVYIGFSVKNNLQAAMKSCVKRDAKEPVGVVLKKNGKYDIVEYSELTDDDANAVDPITKELKFNLGSILIFLLRSDKLLELCNNAATLNQLYHKAFKKISYWDSEKQELVKPDKPNGYKFELFLHNFLPFCDTGKFGVLKVQREEEFGPVKNAEGSGVDSPDTARELIFRLNVKYLRKAGAVIEKDAAHIEIDILLSYEGEGLQDYADGKRFPPPHYIKHNIPHNTAKGELSM